MTKPGRRQFWSQMAVALASAGVFAVTLVWHGWIEIVFRLDPDHGTGWLEWLIVGTAFVATVAFSLGASRTWRRCGLSVAPTPGPA